MMRAAGLRIGFDTCRSFVSEPGTLLASQLSRHYIRRLK